MVRLYIGSKQYSIAVIFIVGFVGLLAITTAQESQTEKPGGNSKCYVCHPAMKTEQLTTDHLEMGITCDICHGASTDHMHDEMLMTKPDLLFGRSEVRKMCSKCHQPGQGREFFTRQDHGNPEAVSAFIEKWTGRMRPNGRNITEDSICTDCHGTHNITKPLKTTTEDDQIQWIPLFNGRDLKGWRSAKNATWTVKSGRLTGTGSSAGDKGSTLWTEKDYEDYLLVITFRATWPVHAGIRTRGENSPSVEVFESGPARTGSVMVPEKGLALVNLKEDIEDRESWNTISIKVQGDRTQVWLNSEEIGVVRTAGPAKGKIGLYIRKHQDSPSSELTVREMLIQPLSKAEE